MAEKNPPPKIPEGASEAAGAASKDLTEFMGRLRAERVEVRDPTVAGTVEEVVPQAVQAARRLHLVEEKDDDKTDAYADIGGGNPEKRRIHNLKDDMVAGFMAIEMYQPFEKGDKNAFMLHQGLMAVYSLSETPGWNIERMVAERMVEHEGDGGKQGRRNKAARLYDSIGVMRDSFNFAVKGPGSVDRREEHLEQFIKDMCPSDIWQDETAKQKILTGLDSAYLLMRMMVSDDHDSIDRFLKKVQHTLVRQGLGFTVKNRRDPGYGNLKRHLENARKLAWKEWDTEAAGAS